MLKERYLSSKLEKYLHHKNALVVTGPRQVGKTSLLRIIFNTLPTDQKLWFDLDNPLDQKLFESIDYKDIVARFEDKGLHKKKRKYIFIDEIQNFPEITKIIKYLIDHFQIKFLVTGSASYYMKNLFPESLAGRKFEFSLKPLSFTEFLYFKGKINVLPILKLDLSLQNIHSFEEFNEDWQEYKRFGGFPEVVLTNDFKDKSFILQNIFKSYFEKDVIKFGQFTEVNKVRDLLLALTQRIGAKLDITRLCSELAISRQTLYSYLYFLEQTFFIHLVPQFSKSISRQIAGGKKTYFLDSGMLNEIQQISAGQLLENTVFQQLSLYGDLTFYQNSSGREIDFILNKKIAFAVKHRGTVYDQQKILKLGEKLNLEKHFIISEEYVEKVSQAIYPQFL